MRNGGGRYGDIGVLAREKKVLAGVTTYNRKNIHTFTQMQHQHDAKLLPVAASFC